MSLLEAIKIGRGESGSSDSRAAKTALDDGPKVDIAHGYRVGQCRSGGRGDVGAGVPDADGDKLQGAHTVQCREWGMSARYPARVSTTRTAQCIDGRAIAAEVKALLAVRVAELAALDRFVRLDVLLSGGNEAGGVYAKNQASMCAELGIEYRMHAVQADASRVTGIAADI